MKTITATTFVDRTANNIICKENDQIEISFEAQPEDISPSDMFDEELMSDLQKTLDNDNDLQYCGVSHNWFCAKVTVSYKYFEATDYLGGCSYASYDEFVQEENGYFADMVQTCVDEINSEIETINANIQKRWNLRKELSSKGEYLFFLQNRKILKTY